MPSFLPSEMKYPRYEARQHAIQLLLRKPAKHWVYVLAILSLAGYLWPWPMGFVLLVAAVVLGFLRWRLWFEERIWLTCKRVIHVQGVIETARTESWLRLDRVSGMRVTDTLFGAWWGYATIFVDAPGDHPGTHELFRIGKALPFYRRFCLAVAEYDGRCGGDRRGCKDCTCQRRSGGREPEFGESSGDYITDELPQVPDTAYRHRRS